MIFDYDYPPLTPEVVAGLISEGENAFWWYRPDVGYFATTLRDPGPADAPMLEVSAAWLDQFDGDWSAVCEQLNPILEQFKSTPGGA